jgi:hypothetical protein
MKRAINFVFALALMLAVLLGATSARAVDIIFVPGNPTCSQYGDWIEYKIENPTTGNYSDGTLNLYLQINSTSMGPTFDFKANQKIYAVAAKGGPNANLYKYAPPVYEDSGLHAPLNRTKYYGLSHISFCYKPALMVVKDAATTFKRTYHWEITKDVAPAAWDLFKGDSGTSEYTVAVKKSGYTDSDWAVSGSIYIYNPAKTAATITKVEDVVSPDIAAVVSCPVTLPYTLPAGALLNCTYTADLPDASTRLNTAAVTTSGMVDGDDGSADVVFDLDKPTVEVNKEINVIDTNGPSWGPVSADTSWKYEKTFTCDADEGQHDNIAAIVETKQYADAQVNVACHDLAVSKDAHTALTRTWNWTIDKSVVPAAWHLFKGDSGTSRYTVAVDKTGYIDSGWAVTGDIQVYNPAPMAAQINAVNDIVSPDMAAVVDCKVTFPYSLAAGETLSCSYSASLPDDASRTNTASAALQNHAYDKEGVGTPTGTTHFSGSAAVNFAAAVVTEVNPSINVEDTNGKKWGPVSDDASWNYDRKFECDADAGRHENTAAIVETKQSDDAAVDVSCYALAVSKDAQTSYTRKWTWEIDKVGDKTELTYGDDFTVNYEVKVSASAVDSQWAVSGKISIYNPAPMAAEITDVVDIVTTNIAADVVCPAMVVPAGETLVCSYTSALPDAASRINTATATLQNYDYDKDKVGIKAGSTSWWGSTGVLFNGPTTEIDECVDVSDDKAGYLGKVCATGTPFSYTFQYPLDIPAEVCGDIYFTNTAQFVTNDTQAEGSDSWTVHAFLPCEQQTAFAYGNQCFLDLGFDRWGWSNGPLSEGAYTYDVYAGAAQCDLSKGTYVGKVKVTYSGGNVSVQFMLDKGFALLESRVYAGYTPVPMLDGKPTVAPGQYTISPNLTGDIYVIVHGVVAGSFE